MIGAFVGGLFDGFKAGQDILEARNKLAINAQLMEANKAYQEKLRNEGSGGTPGVTREDYGGGSDEGTTGSSTPTEALPPEATARGGNKRGWGAPTPEMNDLIEKAAAQYNLPVDVFKGMLAHESNFDPKAYNKKSGAAGIAQFIPKTAESMGLKDPYDITQAIPMSAKLLRENLDRYGGDASNPEQLANALKAYNNGLDQKRWHNPETQAYVGKVLLRAKQFAPGSENRVALPVGSADDEWLRQNAPFPTQGRGRRPSGPQFTEELPKVPFGQDPGDFLPGREPSAGTAIPEFTEVPGGRASALGGELSAAPAPLGRGQWRESLASSTPAPVGMGQRGGLPPDQKYNSQGQPISPDLTKNFPGQQSGAALPPGIRIPARQAPGGAPPPKPMSSLGIGGAPQPSAAFPVASSDSSLFPRRAPDGREYIPDPNRPGKYLMLG